jgi:hypothetical protein
MTAATFLLLVSSYTAFQANATPTFLQRSQEVCRSEGFDLNECVNAVSEAQAVFGTNPIDVNVALEFARAFINIAASGGANGEGSEVFRARGIAAYQHRLTLTPNDPDVLTELSALVEDNEERESLLQRAIAAAPMHRTAHGQLAGVLFALDRIAEAAQSYERHIEFADYRGTGDAIRHMAVAEGLLSNRLVTEAARIVDAVLRLTLSESREIRCQIFEDLPLESLQAHKDLIFRLREVRALCKSR